MKAGKTLTKEPIQTIRNQFWQILLPLFKSDCSLSLFKSKDATKSHYMNSKSDIDGVTWSIHIQRRHILCRVYIDRKEGSEEENLIMLEKLAKDRAKIEKAFGKELEWLISKDRRTAIQYKIPRGLNEPKEDWPAIAKTVHETMKRLVKALDGPISKL